MFRYTLRTVAAYQVVSGAMTVMLIADGALRGRRSLGFVILAGVATLSIVVHA